MTYAYRHRLSAIAFALAFTILAHSPGALAAETQSVGDIARTTHIHGLAVDRSDPNFLFVATHHGLFRAGPDGQATRISEVNDFMGFNAHPTDQSVLYASGHPPTGGNLGFMQSVDGGRSWTEVSPGVEGPVDFHQMTVSPADPATIYGAFRVLQVSHDSGKTWEIAGKLPTGLINLAGSPKDRDRLYAATENGLLVSTDGGKRWSGLVEGVPVTTVGVTPAGKLLAFVVGRGLIAAPEDAFAETIINGDWGEAYLINLAIDPTNPERLYAVTATGDIVFSQDGGKSWRTFGS